ncbi:SGNH/GDSL hydrolase family protein [Maribellus sediminis]|uniref:SGNH/GDSL hydrolase family protein n=1 Tax=Maribellus sediminis TaxID=2696285 RepID=UPI0014311399|nr:SGNH/GDSL hydrolase family protein [Maribellus sediminis]
MMKKVLVILFVLIHAFCSSQNSKIIPFSSGDRVCFVGNSITHDGWFFHNIWLYHITRFPDQQVTFFNCGIAGDVTSGVLQRMDKDILANNPTHVVLMLGMNDVERSLYGPNQTSNIDTLKKRDEALLTYQQNMELIVKTFLAKDIRVILEKPTIYDQTLVSERYNNFGVNDALKTCAAFVDGLADKFELPVVDYWTIMNRLNREMQKDVPEASITGPDRVHPGNTGHFVMSYQFLKTLGAPQLVSEIVIDKTPEISAEKCINCRITSLRNEVKTIAFSVPENALPFPVSGSQKEGLELVPFMQELNQEILRIKDLKNTHYSLYIDSVFIGSFASEVLHKGINLADYAQTPQFRQALEVRKVLEELWVNEAKLRDLKLIEANRYFQELQESNKLSKHTLDSMFTANYTGSLNYRLSKSEAYFTNKPLENDIKMNMISLQEEAFRKAQPIEHRYLLRQVNNKEDDY